MSRRPIRDLDMSDVYADAERMRALQESRCEICDAPADDEMGEFAVDDERMSIFAHASCGLSRELEIA